nr:hypothetical protein [Mycobacterium lepraemurium]
MTGQSIQHRRRTEAVQQISSQADPRKRRILFDAAKTTDLIDRLEKETANQSLTVNGSYGQPVLNPLVAAAPYGSGLMAQLMARLNYEGRED